MKIHGKVGFLKSHGEFHRFVGKSLGFTHQKSISWYNPRYEDKGDMFLSDPHYLILNGLRVGYFTSYQMKDGWYVAASKSILKDAKMRSIIAEFLTDNSKWIVIKEKKYIETGIACRDSGYAYKIFERV